MDFTEFFADSLTYAHQTFFYLLAYAMVPVWALLTSLGLKLLRPDRWGGRLVQRQGRAARLLGSLALAFSMPLSNARFENQLRLLRGRPLETVLYLTTGHGWILYYLFLLGPLMGKDVLFSQLIGSVVFIGTGSLLLYWAGFRTPLAAAQAPLEPSLPRLLFAEVWRVLLWMAMGLLLGGAVAAWGTSPAFTPLVDIFDGPIADQFMGAIMGLLLSILLWMYPVANLFVGTYLWKVGLAHAGLVAFFLACLLSPQRWGAYSRALGASRARRLVCLLGIAAVISGLLTAALLGLLHFEINYKLKPDQLWLFD